MSFIGLATEMDFQPFESPYTFQEILSDAIQKGAIRHSRITGIDVTDLKGRWWIVKKIAGGKITFVPSKASSSLAMESWMFFQISSKSFCGTSGISFMESFMIS